MVSLCQFPHAHPKTNPQGFGQVFWSVQRCPVGAFVGVGTAAGLFVVLVGVEELADIVVSVGLAVFELTCRLFWALVDEPTPLGVFEQAMSRHERRNRLSITIHRLRIDNPFPSTTKPIERLMGSIKGISIVRQFETLKQSRPCHNHYPHERYAILYSNVVLHNHPMPESR